MISLLTDISTHDHNSPGYETRVSPTAVVIYNHKGDLYTILVKNNKSSKGYLFPNGKQEEEDTSSQDGALREYLEETGDQAPLIHIGQLGTLYRQAGTKARDDIEQAILDSKPEGQRFLFLKEQIYQLFMCTTTDITKLHKQLQQSKGSDIEDVQIVPLGKATAHVQIGSDLMILHLLNQYYEQLSEIAVDNTSQLQILKDEVEQYQDTIFS